MADTNMDTKKNPDSTAPQLEFTLPKNELDHVFETGEIGSITIPVEVVATDLQSVTFRKRSSKITSSQFRQASLNEMEENIGTTDR